MRIEILKQALAEVEAERDNVTSKYDSTIDGLKFLIARTSSATNGQNQSLPHRTPFVTQGSDSGKIQAALSFIDLAVEAIASAGTDLHINDIHKYIVERRPKTKRNGLWANLASHVKKTGDKSRLIKSAPGTFGLRKAA